MPNVALKTRYKKSIHQIYRIYTSDQCHFWSCNAKRKKISQSVVNALWMYAESENKVLCWKRESKSSFKFIEFIKASVLVFFYIIVIRFFLTKLLNFHKLTKVLKKLIMRHCDNKYQISNFNRNVNGNKRNLATYVKPMYKWNSWKIRNWLKLFLLWGGRNVKDLEIYYWPKLMKFLSTLFLVKSINHELYSTSPWNKALNIFFLLIWKLFYALRILLDSSYNNSI